MVRIAAGVAAACWLLTAFFGVGEDSAAKAVGCADYDVSFARGTGEPPGLGSVGEAFVSAFRARVAGKSVDAYAVDYPASLDFIQAGVGTNDLSSHIQHAASVCPATKFILGGYSQGAAVVDVLLSDSPPRETYTNPLPRPLDEKIVAVALFGNPANGRTRFSDPNPSVREADLSIRGDQLSKVIDLCNPHDIACDPAGGNLDSHVTYSSDGSADRAAQFVSQRL